jgi:hypothetical protein
MIYNANVSHAQPQLNLRYIFYIDHHMCSYLVRNTQLLEHLIDIFLREIWKRKKKDGISLSEIKIHFKSKSILRI